MSILSVAFFIRLSKVIVLLTVTALGAMVVFGNITDYNSNFQFVSHVMSMDAKPDYLGESIEYRSLKSPILHHIAYISIIAIEFLITLTSLKGAFDMFKNIKADAPTFHEAKRCGIVALTACCFLWFFAFQVVAAEWFGMWMSKTWNGLPDATRLVSYMFMALIYITLKNDD